MKKRIKPRIINVVEDDGRWLDPETMTYYDNEDLEDIAAPTAGLPKNEEEIVQNIRARIMESADSLALAIEFREAIKQAIADGGRAYEEALARAQSEYKQATEEGQAILERVFPGRMQSRDQRIRDVLVGLIDYIDEDGIEGFTKRELIEFIMQKEKN